MSLNQHGFKGIIEVATRLMLIQLPSVVEETTAFNIWVSP